MAVDAPGDMRARGRRLETQDTASAISASAASARIISPALPGEDWRPISRMTDTENGERCSSRACNMRPSMRGQHFAQARDVDQAARSVVAGAAQQQMVGLMAAEHVVDEVGGERDLAAGLALAARPALDQTGDQGAGLERSLHHRALGQPRLQIIAQHVAREEFNVVQIVHRLKRPHRQGVVVAHEAERTHAQAL